MKTLLFITLASLATCHLALSQIVTVHIAVRTDGVDGDGTIGNPRDGSTAARLDAIIQEGTKDRVIELGPGVFETNGTWNSRRGTYDHLGIQLEGNCVFRGQGAGITTLRAAPGVRKTVSGYYDLVESRMGARNVTVSDMTLDARWGEFFTSGTKCGCVRLRGTNSRIARIEAKNWGGDHLNAREAFPVFIAYGYGIIEDNHVHSPVKGGDNTRVHATAVGLAYDGIIRNNRIIGLGTRELYGSHAILASCGATRVIEIYGNRIEGFYEGIHGDSWSGNKYHIHHNTFIDNRRAIGLEYTNRGESLGYVLIENNIIAIPSRNAHPAATAVINGNGHNGPSGVVIFRNNYIHVSGGRVAVPNAGYTFSNLRFATVSGNIWDKGIDTSHNKIDPSCAVSSVRDEVQF